MGIDLGVYGTGDLVQRYSRLQIAHAALQAEYAATMAALEELAVRVPADLEFTTIGPDGEDTYRVRGEQVRGIFKALRDLSRACRGFGVRAVHALHEKEEAQDERDEAAANSERLASTDLAAAQRKIVEQAQIIEDLRRRRDTEHEHAICYRRQLHAAEQRIADLVRWTTPDVGPGYCTRCGEPIDTAGRCGCGGGCGEDEG